MTAEALDLRMMRLAVEWALRAAAVDEAPVGAVVYRGDQVLAAAHNLRESVHDPVGHAEVLALREAARQIGDWRLNACSMAVTLEPCAMCAGAIVNARLGRLVYGAADPKAGAVESLYQICSDRRLNHRPAILSGLMAHECGAVLRDFFRQRRRGAQADEDSVSRDPMGPSAAEAG
jgi:tRNA(adenine34) deaminase